VTVGVGGAVVLEDVADDAGSASSALVDATVEVTANEISVTHGGGDPVAQSSITVVLRGDTTTERYSLNDANLSGDADGEFEASERFRRDHDLLGPTVDVLVVDNGGVHAAQTRSGEIALEGGRHEITVRFFEHTIDDTLTVEYEGPGVPRQEIPTENLTHD